MKALLSDQFWFSIVLMLVLIGAIMTAVAYAILLERKIAAFVQDRVGPNRVGPWGILQPLADGLKFLLKEDIIPRNVERAVFLLAPWLIFIVAMVGFAVIPWGGRFVWPWMDDAAAPLDAQVASVDIGLLYIVAVASLGVYGVVLGGWASNNKYSFYGAMRAAAQMLSYEVPLGMAILTVILTTGYVRLEQIVSFQAQPLFGIGGANWMFLFHPVAALLLFVAALAEANRMPFDLAESEQELVGGYHTEYSAMKLALFFLAEYAHMITSSALMVALFFGGYLVPGWKWLNGDMSVWAMLGRMTVFGAKVFLVICMYMIIRWTIPRLRFDQLMRLAWKSLVPMAMAIVTIQGIVLYFRMSQWWTLVGNVAVLLAGAVIGSMMDRPITGRQLSLQSREQAAAV
jgi:NADH-quinone oxidoreductase subunit H